MKINSLVILFFLSAGLILFSCSTARRVPEGQYLLNKTTINSNKVLSEAELTKIIKQKANRRIFGKIPFYLMVYNSINPEKVERDNLKKQAIVNKKNLKREAKGKPLIEDDSKTFRSFIQDIGEKPVVLDTLLTKKSSKQLELYASKKGFFNAQVKDSTTYKGKKASVHYFIDFKEPYKIRNVDYLISDSFIKKTIDVELNNYLLKSGDNYDEDNILKERERLTKQLKNNGYFNFSKEYINFDIDSALNNNVVDIDIELKNPNNTDGTNKSEIYHKIHKINEIYILTDYDQFNPNRVFKDTLILNNIKFIFNDNIGFRPHIINENIKFKNNSVYCEEYIEATYKKLSDLRVFKLVNIVFEDSKNNLNESSDTLKLNCFIRLTPSIRQSYGIEIEGTTSPSVNIGLGRNLGVEGNLVYSNKNVFKGAEILELKLKGKLEAQQTFGNESKNTFFFNTKEIGPELSLHVPKFLIPERLNKGLKKAVPFSNRTTFTASYNYQERPDFKRRIANLTMSYSGKISSSWTMIINPQEINLVNVEIKNSVFLQINNPYVLASFVPHMTIGPKIFFLYNNQNIKKNRSFSFFSGGIEESGMGIRKIFEKGNLKKNSDGLFELFNGTPFSEYLKADADYRFYNIINEKNSIVYRIAAGAGIPFQNSNALPIEKSYFAGGSNNNRAWAARTLGPGSFYDASKNGTVRIGDINLESNLEYRFNLLKTLNGAVFFDAGNIWLYKLDKNRLEGNFELDKFYKQIAIGGGMGIRFDFSFFVFRLDVGFKLRDPMQKQNEYWVIKNLFNSNWKTNYKETFGSKYNFQSINFGIGYPF